MRFLFVLLAWGLTAISAPAEPRIALVVGNADYATVTSLENSGRDAALIAASLREDGFEVTLLRNATEIDMKRAIAEFGRALREAGPETTGLFYYAGHGVQSFGANYLLPVDVALTVAADLDLVGIEAASVLRQMGSARNRTNIVILDACRDNPFENVPDMNDNGLAEMKAPTGTFLAYATAPGAVALDGIDGNSPFTRALVKAMQEEGLAIEQTFKQVRNEVIAATGGRQTPWDTSSLTADFTFRPGRMPTPEEVAETQLWESVRASGDAVQIMLFLRSYPDGLYEEEARALLSEVMASELEAPEAAVAPAAPAAPAASDEETAMLEAARQSGAMSDYQAYLDAYPDGLYAELVKIEIAAINANATTDPSGPGPEAPPPVVEAPAEPTPEIAGGVLFDVPLQSGVPEIVGRTLIEVTELSPLFPPIEGLPEEMWKTQTCSNCHNWTRDDLCTQAQFYTGQNSSRALSKDHPFGGTFKQNLRRWAEGGCR